MTGLKILRCLLFISFCIDPYIVRLIGFPISILPFVSVPTKNSSSSNSFISNVTQTEKRDWFTQNLDFRDGDHFVQQRLLSHRSVTFNSQILSTDGRTVSATPGHHQNRGNGFCLRFEFDAADTGVYSASRGQNVSLFTVLVIQSRVKKIL